MPRKRATRQPQIVAGNSQAALIRLDEGFPDTVSWWAEQYFRFEVATGESSRRVQRRDLQRFLDFIFREEGRNKCVAWSLRLSDSDALNSGCSFVQAKTST